MTYMASNPEPLPVGAHVDLTAEPTPESVGQAVDFGTYSLRRAVQAELGEPVGVHPLRVHDSLVYLRYAAEAVTDPALEPADRDRTDALGMYALATALYVPDDHRYGPVNYSWQMARAARNAAAVELYAAAQLVQRDAFDPSRLGVRHQEIRLRHVATGIIGRLDSRAGEVPRFKARRQAGRPVSGSELVTAETPQLSLRRRLALEAARLVVPAERLK